MIGVSTADARHILSKGGCLRVGSVIPTGFVSEQVAGSIMGKSMVIDMKDKQIATLHSCRPSGPKDGGRFRGGAVVIVSVLLMLRSTRIASGALARCFPFPRLNVPDASRWRGRFRESAGRSSQRRQSSDPQAPVQNRGSAASARSHPGS